MLQPAMIGMGMYAHWLGLGSHAVTDSMLIHAFCLQVSFVTEVRNLPQITAVRVKVNSLTTHFGKLCRTKLPITATGKGSSRIYGWQCTSAVVEKESA